MKNTRDGMAGINCENVLGKGDGGSRASGRRQEQKHTPLGTWMPRAGCLCACEISIESRRGQTTLGWGCAVPKGCCEDVHEIWRGVGPPQRDALRCCRL